MAARARVAEAVERMKRQAELYYDEERERETRTLRRMKERMVQDVKAHQRKLEAEARSMQRCKDAFKRTA